MKLRFTCKFSTLCANVWKAWELLFHLADFRDYSYEEQFINPHYIMGRDVGEMGQGVVWDMVIPFLILFPVSCVMMFSRLQVALSKLKL